MEELLDRSSTLLASTKKSMSYFFKKLRYAFLFFITIVITSATNVNVTMIYFLVNLKRAMVHFLMFGTWNYIFIPKILIGYWLFMLFA